MSENGWTDDFLCKQWLQKTFIPQVTEQNTLEKPILLIDDGHSSHDTLDVIALSWEHNVLLYCLPPHTMHKFQPLDVGVFGPFQWAWADQCDEIVDNTGEEMPCEGVIKHYMEVWQQTFRAHLVHHLSDAAPAKKKTLLFIDQAWQSDCSAHFATSDHSKGCVQPPCQK